jgi:hypothetical protein
VLLTGAIVLERGDLTPADAGRRIVDVIAERFEYGDFSREPTLE